MNHNSLFFKLISRIILILALLMGCFTYFQIKKTEKRLINDSLVYHRTLAISSLSSLAVALWDYNFDVVIATVESLIKLGEIQKIYLYDSKGKYFGSWEKVGDKVVKIEKEVSYEQIMGTGLPKENLDNELSAQKATEKGLTELVQGDSHVHYLTTTLYYSKNIYNKDVKSGDIKKVGYFIMAYSTDKVQQYITDEKVNFILYVVTLALALLGFIFFFLKRTVIQPLTEITNTSLLVAQGSFVKAKDINSKDEVGVLTKNFNFMIDKIQYSKKLSDLLIKYGHEIVSQKDLWGIQSKILELAKNLTNEELQIAVYFSDKCFLDSEMTPGLYVINQNSEPLLDSFMAYQCPINQEDEHLIIPDHENSSGLGLVKIVNINQNQKNAMDALLILASNMASAIAAVRLKKSLTALDLKMMEIRTIFSNSPIGLCTIDEKLKISKDYSKKMEDILEQHHLYGVSFIDEFLKKTSLSQDYLKQVETVLLSSIGSDILNFELNMQLLPNEVTLNIKNGNNKVIELDWVPFLDLNQKISKLMVCMKDVTLIRKLKIEVIANQNEAKLMGQMIKIDADSFNQFYKYNDQLLEKLIELSLKGAMSDIEMTNFKRIIHTIKGNARTLGFESIAEIAHNIEDVFFKRNKETFSEDNLSDLLISMKENFALLDSLNNKISSRINKQIDNYKSIVKRSHEKIDFLLKHKELQNTLEIYELKRDFCEVETHPLSMIFSKFQNDAKNLAEKLGKIPPDFDIKFDFDVVLNEESDLVLQGCLTHLIANSIDHGFDFKTKAKIFIDFKLKDDYLIVSYFDNGHGLDLKKLKSVGMEKKLIKETASEKEIIDLIFLPGFSTSQKLTLVSGRGVGMEYVKKAPEQFGGHSELVVRNRQDQQDEQTLGFVNFQLNIYIPKKCIAFSYSVFEQFNNKKKVS